MVETEVSQTWWGSGWTTVGGSGSGESLRRGTSPPLPPARSEEKRRTGLQAETSRGRTGLGPQGTGSRGSVTTIEERFKFPREPRF